MLFSLGASHLSLQCWRKNILPLSCCWTLERQAPVLAEPGASLSSFLQGGVVSVAESRMDVGDLICSSLSLAVCSEGDVAGVLSSANPALVGFHILAHWSDNYFNLWIWLRGLGTLFIFAVMSVSSGNGAEQAGQRRECVRATEIVPAFSQCPFSHFWSV